jgi:hypothetical protein
MGTLPSWGGLEENGVESNRGELGTLESCADCELRLACGDKASPGSAPTRAPGQASEGKPGESWRFVVSGDSRNCGDVVMPGIAAGTKLDGASFYWHLGDLRAIYDFDQDMVQATKMAGKHLTIMDYENSAWDDFAANQIGPFENIPMPFYLGVGNHEIIAAKNRCQFSKQFARLLEKPELHNRKTDSVSGTAATSKPANARNSKSDAVEAPQSDAVKECIRQCVDCSPSDSKTYYHWTKDGVDFVYLDNASNEQFDTDQLKWFNDVIKKDTDDKTIRTVVVGMHKAVPWSISCDHSMNESPEGTKSGEQVYRTLLNLQKPDKKVYVLATHSHFFMLDIFNTKHWRDDGGILPGWIVGTAGAQRYPLPPLADLAKSKTYVYGYMLGRVYPDGSIDFEFTELKTSDIPAEIRNRYSGSWVKQACFDQNRITTPAPQPDYCTETLAKAQ